MKTVSSDKNPYAPLRISEFRYFIAGRFLINTGLRMTVTVIAWWVYQLTNSPLALGIVGLSEVLTALSFALYAGHYIDRNEKRSLLLKCIVLYVCCMLMFLILSDDITTRSVSPWKITFMIYGIIAITGAIRAFLGPTFGAMISQIVPKKQLPAAASISSATWLISSILGHSAGGFFIAFLGIHNTFYVTITFIAGSYVCISLLRAKPVFISVSKTTWQSVKQGFTYVFKTKELMGTLTLDLFAVLFGGAVAMVPVFAKDILHTGPIGYGWLNAASDIGSILSVTALTILPIKRKQGKIMLLSVAGFGLFIIIFAISKVFWLSFIALMISGCMDGVSMIVRGTILQLKTPDELRGRVMSVNMMFISSSNELGQFESGIAAKLLGIIPSVIFGGCMTIGVVIATWFKAPTIKEMEY